MQVQHHVGVAGQALQYQSLRLQLGCGGLPGQGGAQCGANQFDIVLRIISEQRLDLVAHLITEVDKQAIEVLPALQLVAAQGDIHQHLFQAHRVGDGHQHDLAQQPPSRRQFGEAHLQVPGHQHAGQLIGMQRRLDVNLACGLLRAEVETVDLPRRAWHRRNQFM